MKRILLVEDNPDLVYGLRNNLEIEGYDVSVAEDGPSGVQGARELQPDLVILDLMLPGMDGFEILRGIRGGGNDLPVLILSARGEEQDKIRGFRLDADQYVTKPFSLVELLERVHALLRRSTRGGSDQKSGALVFGEVVVDPAARTVTRSGEPVALSPKAFDLLLSLIRREGRVASRMELLREVWGYGPLVLSRTVDSHVAELRRRLENDPADPRHILTVFKVGYRFER